jgi:hypothetical protein
MNLADILHFFKKHFNTFLPSKLKSPRVVYFLGAFALSRKVPVNLRLARPSVRNKTARLPLEAVL